MIKIGDIFWLSGFAFERLNFILVLNAKYGLIIPLSNIVAFGRVRILKQQSLCKNREKSFWEKPLF